MNAIAKIRRIGNSFGVLLSRGLLERARVSEGERVLISLKKVEPENMFGIWEDLPPFEHKKEDHEL
jgi:antitoxin component of MazEF toxin-antitoxin module